MKRRSLRTVVTALTSLALSGALLTPVATAAVPSGLWSPFPLAKPHSVDVTDVSPSSSAASKPVMGAFQATHVSWPKAVTATITVDAAPAVAPLMSPRTAVEAQPFTTSRTSGRAIGTPVAIGSSGVLDSGLLPRSADVKSILSTHSDAVAPGTVRVGVASHGAAQAADVQGVIVSLTRVEAGQAGPAQASVVLDYSTFAEAYGGDYASRLPSLSALGETPRFGGLA